jgi:hypothetical protein
MARKYARDNRGRFAPKGAGATARGGRLKTAGGNKRETQKIAALSGDRMSSVPKGAIGKTRKQREITMIDRPQGQRVAYNQGRAQQQAAIAARKAPRPSAAKRIKANAPSNTLGNKTGQSKTLNRFNSRPERTRGAYVGGRYVDKAKLTGRQPLDLGRGDDRAFGRVATKSAQKQAAVSSRKAALEKGAQRSNSKADRIDRKVAALEKQYRGKDSAFYTQGVKPAGRDQMIAKSRQAAQLREQSASLRQKASNAQRMASRIKPPAAPKSSGGNARLERAIRNETAGSTQARRNPKGYQKRITALTAQQIYKTGDFMAGLSVAKAAGKGFRLPRAMRRR